MSSKTPWTPGPWHVDGYKDCQLITKDVPVAIGRPIGIGRTYGENQIANARLIAAAPELLEVLRTVIYGDPNGNFQFMMAGNPNAQDKFLAHANALLSRIEGGEA